MPDDAAPPDASDRRPPTPAQFREAEVLVASALLSAFPLEPLIGPRLSRAFSLVQSVIRRHGLILQKAFADVLAETGRFLVRSNMRFLISGEKVALASTSLADDDHNPRRGRIVEADTVVLELASARCSLCESKRGLGPTAARKRAATCADLELIRQSLESGALRLEGMRVKTAVARIIDYYGGSGFPHALTLHGAAIDAHFDAAICERLDLMTGLVARALRRALPNLFDGPAPVQTAQAIASPAPGAPKGLRRVLAQPPSTPRRRSDPIAPCRPPAR